MNPKLLEELLSKYQLPKDQRYQIRFKDKTLSPPMNLEEIAEALLHEKLNGEEEISPYPQENFRPIAKEPIFYDLLVSFLEEIPLSEAQKEDITRVLKTTEIPLFKHKKGAVPSKIIPSTKIKLHTEESSLEKEDLPKSLFQEKKQLFIFIFSAFVLLSLISLFFLLPKAPKKETSTPKKVFEEIIVSLPSETIEKPDPQKAKLLFEKAKPLFFKDTVRSYKETVTYLLEALRFLPGDSASLAILAKSYLYLWDLSKKDEFFFKDSLTLIERALKINPTQKEALEAKSLWLLRRGRTEAALTLINEVIKKNPDQGESLLIRGEILYVKSSYDEAILSFEKALELDLSLARAHYLLGKSYQKKNQPEKAYEVFWIGLNAHPEHTLSRLEASLIDIQTFNNLSKAEGNLKIVTQFPSLLSPFDLAQAHYHLGWIYEEKRQIDFALKEYKKALEINPLEIYQAAFQKLGGNKAISQLNIDPNIQEESLYFVQIGRQYFEEGRLTDALAQYKAAIQTDSKNYLAEHEMGKLYEAQKKWRIALEHYRKAIELKGTFVEAYVAISKIHIHYFNFKDALLYLEQVKAIEPRSALIYTVSGDFYRQKGDKAKAVAEYRKATELDPDNFEAHFELASLYLEQKEYKKSEEFFFSALRIKPDEARVRTKVAQLYFEQGLKAQAVQFLKQLSKAYPLNPQYVAGLGKIYTLAGDFNFAKEAYLKALSLDDQHLEALEGLAQTYESEEAYPKAIETYKKLIRIDPSDAKWYFLQAKLFEKIGNIEEALKHFKLSVQINFNYPLAHFHIAGIAVSMGNFNEAENEYKKEIQINPHLKESYLAFGNLLASQEKFDQAQENYRMYIRLDPSNTDVYLKLGTIHALQKRFETAIEFFKTALEKNPDEGYAYFQLGIIYKELERKSDALEAFENYLRVSPDAPNVEQVKKVIKDLKRF